MKKQGRPATAIKKKMMGVYIPIEDYEKIRRMAEKQNRSVCNMACMLLQKALQPSK